MKTFLNPLEKVEKGTSSQPNKTNLKRLWKSPNLLKNCKGTNSESNSEIMSKNIS